MAPSLGSHERLRAEADAPSRSDGPPEPKDGCTTVQVLFGGSLLLGASMLFASCDPADGLVEPNGLMIVMSMDTIACPWPSLSGCELYDPGEEEETWLGALESWFDTFEYKTEPCMAAYETVRAALLTGLSETGGFLFTYTGDSEADSVEKTIRMASGTRFLGVRRGEYIGNQGPRLLPDGTIQNEERLASTLLHAGFHLLGEEWDDAVDAGPSGPDGMITFCQNAQQPD